MYIAENNVLMDKIGTIVSKSHWLLEWEFKETEDQANYGHSTTKKPIFSAQERTETAAGKRSRMKPMKI